MKKIIDNKHLHICKIKEKDIDAASILRLNTMITFAIENVFFMKNFTFSSCWQNINFSRPTHPILSDTRKLKFIVRILSNHQTFWYKSDTRPNLKSQASQHYACRVDELKSVKQSWQFSQSCSAAVYMFW